jgi:hypothetical protein
MDTDTSVISYVATSFAFGIFIGYIIGLTLGAAWGKQRLIKKIRLIASREKVNFDVDRILQSELNQVIQEDFL